MIKIVVQSFSLNVTIKTVIKWTGGNGKVDAKVDA